MSPSPANESRAALGARHLLHRTDREGHTRDVARAMGVREVAFVDAEPGPTPKGDSLGSR